MSSGFPHVCLILKSGQNPCRNFYHAWFLWMFIIQTNLECNHHGGTTERIDTKLPARHFQCQREVRRPAREHTHQHTSGIGTSWDFRTLPSQKPSMGQGWWTWRESLYGLYGEIGPSGIAGTFADCRSFIDFWAPNSAMLTGFHSFLLGIYEATTRKVPPLRSLWDAGGSKHLRSNEVCAWLETDMQSHRTGTSGISDWNWLRYDLSIDIWVVKVTQFDDSGGKDQSEWFQPINWIINPGVEYLPPNPPSQ